MAVPPDKPTAKPPERRRTAGRPAAKRALTATKMAKQPEKTTESEVEAQSPAMVAPPENEASKRAAKSKPAAKRASPRKAKAPAKPRAQATVPPIVATSMSKVKAAAAALPEVTPRRAAVAAATTGGLLAAIGAGLFLLRASKADQPDYRLIERDGDFEIREYPAMVTAATESHGPRAAALNRGFDILANYIFAKSRPGKKIAMTAPVLSDGSSTSRWRTRFIMPAGTARADLPSAPGGVTLENEPPRRVAAVRFAGRADDALLASKEGALRSWLQLRNLPSEAKAEHAFYNSPMMPGPLRRNEVLVTLSTH